MELSTEDKGRIYKEVNRIFNESESVDLVHELMFKVGEYEHKYQREQQAKRIEELENVISDTIYEWKQGDGMTGMMITKLKLILNKKP